jgi:radical SAM protein with 4Fe4S-binding SPASM domain
MPASDKKARKNELTLLEINNLVHQATDLGALWCLITGGEPLIRKDFPDIYLSIKKQGLLVSVFTNACLITPQLVKLFQEYPPRIIEVSVYGITPETYEKITRKPGSYNLFRRGLDLLLEGNIKVRLKAMALKSNLHEITEIGKFCREHTVDYYRFDPLLNLRHDGDPKRNQEIIRERLSAQEIAILEQNDDDRRLWLQNNCTSLIRNPCDEAGCDHIFHCGAGKSSFTIGHDGKFRLCSSLIAPNCTIDLRNHSLAEAWFEFTPKVRDQRSVNPHFQRTCQICPLVNLCLWCPANAYLESGELDESVDYFCQVAHARAEMILKKEASQF